MTFEEFQADIYQNRPEEQRLGQWAFNRLAEVRPDIAAEARTSSVDPFYDDTRVAVFLWFAKRLW